MLKKLASGIHKSFYFNYIIKYVLRLVQYVVEPVSDLIQFEQLFRGVRQLSQGERWVQVDLSAQGGDHLLPVVPVREHAAGGDQAVDRVRHGANQHSGR